MFVHAIEVAAEFTRPIHTISRLYGSTSAIPGAATLTLVNDEGWALTCGHVAAVIAQSDAVNAQFAAFKAEQDALGPGRIRRHQLHLLEKKYGYDSKTCVQLFNNFVNCVDAMNAFRIIGHPTYDVALVKFEGANQVACNRFPVFAANGTDLLQGKSICRLGFPFPEFQNFEYDPGTDSIRWNNDPRAATPRFPIDGMVTRHLLSPSGEVAAFELSTPGLRGQSGGPAFDTEGRVWGIQSATNHLDLDFDVDKQVLRQGVAKRVTNHPFLHVGVAIHVDILKTFMTANGVNFAEG